MRSASAAVDVGPLRWLIAALAVATVPLAIDLPPWEALGIAGGAWWRWQRTRRGLGAVNRHVLLGMVPLIGGALYASGALGFGLALAAPALVACCWLKLLEMQSERDYQLCCFLCVLLLAVLLFDQQTIATCVYALIAITLTVMAMARYQVAGPALALMRPRCLRLMALAAPLALVLFLLIPRLQLNLPNVGGEGISGFTDTMRPGDIARMATGDKVAFRVEFADNQLPPGGELYWRGLVMNESSDGALWRVNLTEPAERRSVWAGAADLPLISQDIVLMPNGQPWLFALEDAVGELVNADLRKNGTVRYHQRVNHVLHYAITSRFGDRATDADHQAALPLAKVHPEVQALAERLKAGTDGSADQACERILAYYHDQGFTYTLSPGRMDEESVYNFLFVRKEGFCAHYATAFAALMRVMGHPARVVVGYHGGEANSIGGFVVVRQEHAHAWAEYREGDGSWKHVDPTLAIPVKPGEELAAAQQPGAALSQWADRTPAWIPAWLHAPYQSVSQWWQFAEARWDGWFMGFDGDRQSSLLARLGLGHPGPWTLTGLMLLVALGGLLLLLLRLLGPAWLRRGARVPADPVQQLYQRWCARLARSGAAREPWEGPLAFAERASALLPEQAGNLREAAATYARLRYAQSGEDAPAGMRRFAALIRQLPARRPPSVQVSSS